MRWWHCGRHCMVGVGLEIQFNMRACAGVCACAGTSEWVILVLVNIFAQHLSLARSKRANDLNDYDYRKEFSHFAVVVCCCFLYRCHCWNYLYRSLPPACVCFSQLCVLVSAWNVCTYPHVENFARDFVMFAYSVCAFQLMYANVYFFRSVVLFFCFFRFGIRLQRILLHAHWTEHRKSNDNGTLQS